MLLLSRSGGLGNQPRWLGVQFVVESADIINGETVVSDEDTKFADLDCKSVCATFEVYFSKSGELYDPKRIFLFQIIAF